MSDTIERPPAAPPARQDSRPLSQLTRVADLFTNKEFLNRMEKAATGAVNTSLMLSALAGSLRRSPTLSECSVADVAGKALLLTQAGLPPDTVTGMSHLIPFKEKVWNPATRTQEERYVCQMVIGYHGLLDLAYRSGKVDYVTGRVAWRDELESRAFEFQLGTEEWLKHIPGNRQHDLSPEAQANGTAEFPTHAYAIATLSGGRTKPFEVWSAGKVLAIRDSTPAYSYARYALSEAQKNNRRLPAAFAKAPWVAFAEKMMAKTMVRQLCTWLPRSIELATMAALDETQERRTIDLGPIIDSTDYVSAAVDAAEMSGDPGAAFGYRSEDEQPPPPEPPQAPAQPRQQRAPRQTAAKAPQPPPPPPEPPQSTAEPSSDSSPRDATAEQAPPELPPTPTRAVPPFDEWLLDEQGEPTGDRSYTDPVAFMRAYETLWAASNAKETLREQNADALQAAKAAGGPAANMVESMDAPPPIMVPLRTGRDGPVWVEYIREFKMELARQTADSFMDFYAANRVNVLKAPPSTLSLLAKATVERCKAIGTTVPDDLTKGLQAAASVQPQQSAEDKDRRQANNILEEIARITDANALRAYSRNAAVSTPRARWKAEGKDDLLDEITRAFEEKLANLTAGDAA